MLELLELMETIKESAGQRHLSNLWAKEIFMTGKWAKCTPISCCLSHVVEKEHVGCSSGEPVHFLNLWAQGKEMMTPITAGPFGRPKSLQKRSGHDNATQMILNALNHKHFDWRFDPVT